MTSQFFQCPNCQATNANGSRFCSHCGTPFAAPAPPVIPKKQSFPAWAIALIACIGLCGICGAIGNLSDKNKTQIAVNTSTQNSNNQNAANVQATPTPPPTFVELKAKAQPLLAMGNGEHSRAELNAFDDVLKPLREIPKEAKEYKEAQKLLDQLIKKSSVIGAEILVMGEKPINSEWDGSVRPAENYLKQVLNDYSSSEYISWSPVAKVYIGKEPYWGTKVKLRAKNAFGAFIIKDIVFLIRNNQVVKAEGL